MKNIYTLKDYSNYKEKYYISIGKKANWNNICIRVPKFVANCVVKYISEQ